MNGQLVPSDELLGRLLGVVSYRFKTFTQPHANRDWTALLECHLAHVASELGLQTADYLVREPRQNCVQRHGLQLRRDNCTVAAIAWEWKSSNEYPDLLPLRHLLRSDAELKVFLTDTLVGEGAVRAAELGEVLARHGVNPKDRSVLAVVFAGAGKNALGRLASVTVVGQPDLVRWIPKRRACFDCGLGH
ncbi:MAG TPA: hypothetical protein VMH22_03910 [bacterium]|nr:hypothetical protein [bacterium]